MEITRPAQIGFTPLSETQGSVRVEPKALELKDSAETLRVLPSKDNLRLDRMQQTLREMPDVDDARIAEIRRALGTGEISSDAKLLAASIVSYHRGNTI